MVVELGSEYAVFAQTTYSHMCKRKICICANAESVFVQPWRAVFAHSSPHCPLTPCHRWNTNIEQAKNEEKFNSCQPSRSHSSFEVRQIFILDDSWAENIKEHEIYDKIESFYQHILSPNK